MKILRKICASRLILLFILCSALVSLSEIRIVKASGTIYIRSDGSVEGTDKIQRDGDVYTFTANIYDPIVVERDNIVVDGAGYTLQGTGWGTGINVTRRSNVGNVTIKNMQIRYFTEGILLHSHNSTVSGNNITNCVAGIKVVSSTNKITGNYFTANLPNTCGIEIQESKNSIIYGNTMIGNKDGIRIDTTLTNLILGNNITSNEHGIYSEGWSANQIIYHNNLIDNTNQVGDNALLPYSWAPLAVHVWDNGKEGNYWSDYTGVDADGDGIGDTPYHINALIRGNLLKSNQDPYPLMKPVNISAIVIPEFPDTTPPTTSIISPENKTYTVTDVPLTFTVSEATSWMGYSLNAKANVTITGNTTLTELSDGSHNLIVYAKDVAGNTGASETIYFSIKTFPTWIVATIIIVAIAVVGAALLVYFGKIRK